MTDVFEDTRSTLDHDTSVLGDRDVSDRAPNQRERLLRQFRTAGDKGLTDDAAALPAGLSETNYWKRCGELRAAGLIRFNGQKRKGASNVLRKVSVTTL